METFHHFIGFKAACDSVLEDKLYEAMAELNIPGKLIKLVRRTKMRYFICYVQIHGDLSGFATRMSFLFNKALE